MIIDQATELRQLVRKDRQSPAARGPTTTRLWLVTSGNTGAGASTSALHLAMTLQSAGHATLLVDADPAQAGVTSICRLQPRYVLADVLDGRRSTSEITLTGPGGIRILPGHSSPDAVRSWTEPAQMRLVAELRSGEAGYDSVVLDGGNFSQPGVRRFWQSADGVIVVANPEMASIMDAYAAMKLMAEAKARAAIWTLVTKANSAEQAEDVHGRLVRASQRFLSLAPSAGGWIPVLASPMSFDAVPLPQLSPLLQELCRVPGRYARRIPQPPAAEVAI